MNTSMTTMDIPARPRRRDYNHGLPAGIETTWGCRAIVNQHSLFDILGDRTDAVGPHAEVLLGHRDDTRLWQETTRQTLKTGVINTRDDHDVVVWPDRWVVIKANPLRSTGYRYVCAYPVSELVAVLVTVLVAEAEGERS